MLEETEDASLVRTCHLCGKAQCGQRKGRVRCAYCKRIFCLQQLYKKFKIKANVEDKNFKCPRCMGTCCCVCNCQRPPPHVHCKVYKVRQNKKRGTATEMIPPTIPQEIPPVINRPDVQPMPVYVNYPSANMSPLIPIQQEPDVMDIPDSMTTSYNLDYPGSIPYPISLV